MRKLGSSSLLPLDLEIEKTARRNKKKAKEARNQSSIMADQNDPPDPNAQRRLRVKEAYDRTSSKKVAGVYEVDPLTSFSAQMVSQFEALNKKLESFSMDRHQLVHPAHQVQNVSIFCDMCGEGHPTQQCPLIYHDGAQSNTVNYVGNSSNQQNNPYSNTYNPGWRNHPNFSWNNNARPNMLYKPNAPPGFQQNQRPHEMEKKPTTEDLLLQYMQKTDALIQSQSASMRALEMQVGQLASAINNRPQGSLPSDTEPNPKNDKREHCKSITLRSGKEIEGDDDVHIMTHHNMDALELSLQEVGDESCEEIAECIKELNALPTYRRTFQKFESFEMPEKSKASKPSIEEPPEVELKQLPAHLKYAFLGENSTLPVIVSSTLSVEQEEKLLRVLKEYKRAIGWKIADIRGPFKVVQVYPYGAVEVEDMHSGRTFKVNGQRLKPYLGGDIDRNVSSITLSEL
ncbi:hypothetical protein POM88_035714 [Heracleum sosnowskyi]|uniref:Uncharacterized protein n=1 Tax=Heracleum sosnowskyi TaxID=360622 RepID=A0AAD8HLT6_9APIA|nr:hypothetical protein POM88_035714 [Heracleum sosnowskyi]